MIFSITYAGIDYQIESPAKNDVPVLLLAKINADLRKNKLPILPKDNFDHLRKACFNQLGLVEPKIDKRLTAADMWHGSKVLLDLALAKGLSSGPELDRRASICSTCPIKTKTASCFSCELGAKIAGSLSSVFAKKELVKYGLKEYYCGACGCSCGALVQVANAKDLPRERLMEKPTTCWQHDFKND